MSTPIATLDLVIKGINEASAPIRQVRADLMGISSAAGQLGTVSRSLSAVDDTAKTLRTSMGRAGEEFGKLLRLARNASIPLGLGIVAGVQKFVSYGDEVARTADRIGLSSKAFQELAAGASLVDIERGTFTEAMSKLALNLAEVSAGRKGPAYAALEFLKVRTQLKGVGFDVEKSLGLISDALDRVDDPKRKLQIASVLFGRFNKEFLDFVGKGSGALDEMRNAAQRAGVVLSDFDLAQIAQADDQLDSIMLLSKGLALTIAADLLPAVLEIIKGMKEWLDNPANRNWLRTELVPALVQVVTLVPKMVIAFHSLVGTRLTVLALAAAFTGPFLLSVGRAAVAFVAYMLSMRTQAVLLQAQMAFNGVQLGFFSSLLRVTGVSALLSYLAPLKTLALFLRVQAVSAFGALTAAIRASSFAFLLSPVGLFIAGVAVVIGLGTLLYLKWKPFRDAVDGIVSDIKTILTAPGDFLARVRGADYTNGAGDPYGGAPRMAAAGAPPTMMGRPGSDYVSTQRVSGRIGVDIGIPRGASATVRRLESSPAGFDLDVGALITG